MTMFGVEKKKKECNKVAKGLGNKDCIVSMHGFIRKGGTR